MQYFSMIHPIVSFLYFLSVIGFSMFLRNPICVLLGLFSATIYSIMLNGTRTLKMTFLYFVPLLILISIINPLFNHRGITVLWKLKNGNAITLEAYVYGLFAACLLIAVMQWFTCINRIMTEDKIIFIFGRIFPSLSLVISMIFRFVPRYREQYREVSNGQKQLGLYQRERNIFIKLKNGIRVLSIMVTWALEHAVETARSMKNRGYGLEHRTAYSLYQWNPTDVIILMIIVILDVLIALAAIKDIFVFSFYPTFLGAFLNNYPTIEWHGWMWGAYIVYGILVTLPIGMEICHAKRNLYN